MHGTLEVEVVVEQLRRSCVGKSVEGPQRAEPRLYLARHGDAVGDGGRHLHGRGSFGDCLTRRAQADDDCRYCNC